MGGARDSVLAQAVEQYRAGRISAARTTLSAPRSPAELILAYRLALHVADYTACETYAREAAVHKDASGGQRTLARLMRDCVLELRGVGAEEVFDVARLADAGDMLGDVVYYVALLAFYQRQNSVADNWLRSHTPADPALRALYLNLRGIIASAREDFIEQGQLTRSSIELLRSEAPDHIPYLSASAYLLAALIREVPLVGGAELLETVEREIAWTDDLATAHFHILRSLAWASALRSLYEPAMQLLYKALPLARTPSLQSYAYLDQATIALFAGDRATPKATFELADQLVKTIDWANVRDETITLLPYMAQVGADIDPARARVYADMAKAHSGNLEPRYLLAHGTRMRAFVGEAIALAYDSDSDLSVAEATAAYDRFDPIGYGWRAGRMAIHLLRLTGDPVWRDRAQTALAPYGESPFARLLARLSMARRRLGAREHQVLRLLERRLTRKEIAQELGIAENTVRVYVGKVHYAFNVQRTSQLIELLESA